MIGAFGPRHHRYKGWASLKPGDVVSICVADMVVWSFHSTCDSVSTVGVFLQALMLLRCTGIPVASLIASDGRLVVVHGSWDIPDHLTSSSTKRMKPGLGWTPRPSQRSSSRTGTCNNKVHAAGAHGCHMARARPTGRRPQVPWHARGLRARSIAGGRLKKRLKAPASEAAKDMIPLRGPQPAGDFREWKAVAVHSLPWAAAVGIAGADLGSRGQSQSQSHTKETKRILAAEGLEAVGDASVQGVCPKGGCRADLICKKLRAKGAPFVSQKQAAGIDGVRETAPNALSVVGEDLVPGSRCCDSGLSSTLNP